jgi:hypothetical protein
MAIPNTSAEFTWNLSTPDSGLQIGVEYDNLYENDNDLQDQIDTLDTSNSGKIDSSILTTEGDLFVRGVAAIERLGVGSEEQVLTVTSGVPAWETPPDVSALIAAEVPGEVASQLASLLSTDSVLCDTIGTTTAGWGSTDTKVVRFTNVTTTGTAATGASTAANGTTITVNTTGLYHVTGVCRYGAAGSVSLVLTINSSDLTTDPFQASINGGRLYWQHEGSTSLRNSATISGLLYLTATDIIRLHGSGTNQALHADWRLELRPIFLG